MHKVYISTGKASFVVSFNSLQTGKHICTKKFERATLMLLLLFQFPSNGKAYMHADPVQSVLRDYAMFQFPSNGKAYMHLLEIEQRISDEKFQFPSNGKAYMVLAISS